MYLNKVFLIGNLTRDPDLRYTPSGVAVCDMRIAVNSPFKTPEGERREEPIFIDIETWDKLANRCHEFLKKGSSILVIGSLKLDEWESKEGEKRSKIKVRAQEIQFFPKKPAASPTVNDLQEAQQQQENTNDVDDISEDKIPF